MGAEQKTSSTWVEPNRISTSQIGSIHLELGSVATQAVKYSYFMMFCEAFECFRRSLFLFVCTMVSFFSISEKNNHARDVKMSVAGCSFGYTLDADDVKKEMKASSFRSVCVPAAVWWVSSLAGFATDADSDWPAFGDVDGVPSQHHNIRTALFPGFDNTASSGYILP